MPHKDRAVRLAYQKAYRDAHPERKAKMKQWWVKNRATQLVRLREYAYRRRYGITVATYEALLAAQGGRCAICKTDTSRGRGRFHVDHDHATNTVRGILCHNCNTKMGWVETYMKEWAAYLAKAVVKDAA